MRQKNLLLILDNFEHLLDGVSQVHELLAAAPSLEILVTSREQLKLSGETVFSLKGLHVPEIGALGDEDLGQLKTRYSAVRFFNQQVRRVRPDFEPSINELASIVDICRLVQGMPLGLMLAATWSELLSLAEIADQIREDFDFLEAELHDMPSRQRSMRVVFDHSWTLLTNPERIIFQQLSVFRGGFTREAAQTVTRASLRTLMGLVHKSILQRTETGRFEVHELLRQYGAEKLAEKPMDESAVRQRHSLFYGRYLQQKTVTQSGNQQQAILEAIEIEFENVQLAWQWAVDTRRVDIIAQTVDALYLFYTIHSQFQEGYNAFARAIEKLQFLTQQTPNDPDDQTQENYPPIVALTKLLARQSYFCQVLGHHEDATKLAHTSIAHGYRWNVKAEIAFSLNVLGNNSRQNGRFTDAEKLYQVSLAIYRALDDADGRAHALNRLGWAAEYQGAYAKAVIYLQESLELYRLHGHQYGMAQTLDKLGANAWRLGKYRDAEQHFRECLAISQQIGDQLSIARALGGLSEIAWSVEKPDWGKAKQLAEESLELCRQIGHRLEVASRLNILNFVLGPLEEYEAEYQSAQESLSILDELRSQSHKIQPLNFLSEAACGLGDFEAARLHLHRAINLSLGLQEPTWGGTMQALVNWAKLLVQEHRVCNKSGSGHKGVSFTEAKRLQALEALALVRHHPASWCIFKDQAARIWPELSANLSPEAIAAAEAKGKTRIVNDLLAEILKG